MLAGHRYTEDRIWNSRVAAARMAYNTGKLHDAERLALRALADAENTTDARLSRSVTFNYLSIICLATDRFSEAEQYLQDAEAEAASGIGPEYSEVLGSIFRNMANLKVDQKRYAEAETLFRQARKLLRSCLPESALELAQCLSDMSWMMLLQRRFTEALPVAQEALNIFSHSIDCEAPALERARFIYQACIYGDDEAHLLPLIEATAEKVQYEVGPHNPDLVRALKLFTKYLQKTGKQDLLEDVRRHFSAVLMIDQDR